MSAGGTGRRRALGLGALLLIVVAIGVVRMFVDRAPGGPLILAWPESSFATYRWTSLLMGAVIGASLATSGVLLQALLRNPLASPFILGISSGAGLGLMVGMYAVYVLGTGALGEAMGTVPALAGSLFILLIVYLLGRRRGILDPLTLVLVGVVLAAMCNAGMMILELLVPNRLRGDLLFWMMGRIPQGIGASSLAVVSAICVVGLLVATAMGRAMDVATLDEDEARSVGLSIGPVRAALFLLAGALTAATVAVAGPIGFVGLVAPHAARLVVGPRHTTLVLGAALAGAALVVAADAASQALDFGAGRMPVGVFTALIGGPAFIWLLRTGRGQS